MAEISARQQEIIEAAAKILTHSGVGGLTTKNLANEMKFSESAIYRHFESKEEILLAMLDYVLVSMMDSTHFPPPKDDASPAEQLKWIFQNQIAFFDVHPHLAVAIFSDGLLEESSRINEKVLNIMKMRKMMVEPLVAQGQENGVFTPAVSAENITHIVMSSVRLLMFQWRVSNFGFDVKKRGDSLLDSIFLLIKK